MEGIMPQLPTAPYFVCCRKQHWIQLSLTAETRAVVTRLTLLSDWDEQCTTYDADGATWRFRLERPASGFSALARFAARVAYNPRHEVGVAWRRVRRYELPELKDAYVDAIDRDDDILTQFVEPEELRERVRRCESFQDLVETWRWMETDYSLDEESD
jgi:hypothetical protein